MRCGFLTSDPFIRISVFVAKLSWRYFCWRILEDFHCQEYIEFFDKLWPLQASALHHWLLTIAGLHDFVKVSNSAKFKSSLLIMCIESPESTTNSLSSSLSVDGAGRHQFSEGEKNAVLCFSFIFRDIFGQPPRCFTGTSLLPFRIFLRPIHEFWSIGVTLMMITSANQSERRISVSNVNMTYDGFCELYTSDWFPYV